MSPLYLGKSPQKVIFSGIIHTYFWYLCHVRRKQTVLPTPPENVTILTCELLNFFIWLKVCCKRVLEALKRASCGLSSMPLKRTSCDVWQLECQASSVTAVFRVTTFCISTCFQSFSRLIGHIVHHAVLKFSPCHNKPMLQASTCPCQYTRSSCSMPQMQY